MRIALICLLLFVSYLQSAPVPFPPLYKPIRESHLIGKWEMIWRNNHYMVFFQRDGIYIAGNGWKGKWSLDKDNKLHVVEYYSGGNFPVKWSIQLEKGKLAGYSIGDNQKFILIPWDKRMD